MAADRPRGSRWAALAGALTIIAGTVVMVSAGAVDVARASVRNPFTPPVFETQDNAAIVLIGNSQMTCPNGQGCSPARNAAPITAGTDTSINNELQPDLPRRRRLGDDDVELDVSRSEPSRWIRRAVRPARLGWRRDTDSNNGNPTVTEAQARAVKFRVAGSNTYQTLTAGAPATETPSSRISAARTATRTRRVDVTSQVQAAGNGTYWVGDIAATQGVDRYAGWSLVVAYRNPRCRCATWRSSTASPT